jgi:hypothetical protein
MRQPALAVLLHARIEIGDESIAALYRCAQLLDVALHLLDFEERRRRSLLPHI